MNSYLSCLLHCWVQYLSCQAESNPAYLVGFSVELLQYLSFIKSSFTILCHIIFKIVNFYTKTKQKGWQDMCSGRCWTKWSCRKTVKAELHEVIAQHGPCIIMNIIRGIKEKVLGPNRHKLLRELGDRSKHLVNRKN